MTTPNDEPKEPTEGSGARFSPTHTLVYEKEQILVGVNRWRLQLLCDDLIKGQNRPTLNDAWPWLGTFTACLLGLLPVDGFKKDFLGLSASTWETLLVAAAVGSFFMFVRAVVRAIQAHMTGKPKSAEEVVAELMKEIVREEQSK